MTSRTLRFADSNVTMPDSIPPALMAVKAVIPPLCATALSRRRLLVRLDETSAHPLTVIRAPAGYGKTTLLADWARARAPTTRIAWLSLDSSDNDVATFLHYVVLAMSAIEPGIGHSRVLRDVRLLRSTPAD